VSASYRQALSLSYKATDLVVMVGSFVLAVVLVVLGSSWQTLPRLLTVRLKPGNLMLFLLLMAAWYLIFAAFGLYRSRRLASVREETVDVVKATSVGSMVVLGVDTLLVDIDLVTAPFMVAFWGLSAGLTSLARLSLRLVLVWFRLRGRNLRNLVIVGTNRRALRFADLVENKPTLGYQILGFVDEEWRGVEAFRQTGRPLLTRLGDFGTYLREQVVDEVVIALPVSSHYAQFAHILRACEEQGVLVHMLPDFFDVSHARLRLEFLEDQPVITLRTGAMEGWPLLVKRSVDVALSVALLIVLAPLFALVAVLIKLTSPGPVFFVQERVGLHKRPFRFVKFRTMVQDAEKQQAALERLNQVDGPVFKIWKDPRMTPFGSFLRRTSIDELPQLLNVLMGHMSLVGPRPLPIRDYRAFDADWHRRRFSVRPGMTCLWQIGGRNSIPFEKWMEMDMQYIDEWSLWLDFKILAGTVPAVMGGKGAA
jgi:exopolysaccharide biosynthesis polyprenyl glycosylphosphotransferase